MLKYKIKNSALENKKKFKEIMLTSISLMKKTNEDQYNFYTEEALELYDEFFPMLKEMGFTYKHQLMTLFYVMSIVHMLEKEWKYSINIPEVEIPYNNVIDFFKYKNNRAHLEY